MNHSKKREYFSNTPLLKTKVVAFGQGGGRIADIFASYTKENKERSYDVRALNSNDADFSVLNHIPANKRVSLGLGGLGKNPERAVKLFKQNPKIVQEIDDFVLNLLPKENEEKDDLILFIATIGGGTGTSTLLTAIESYYRLVNKPIIDEEIAKMRDQVGMQEMVANKDFYMKEIMENAELRMTKIGVIAVTPPQHEGADVLRQSYNFISKLWKASTNPSYGVAFVSFPDNNHFFKKFNELGTEVQRKYKSVNDYANIQIAETFHSIFTACGQENSDVILDKADLKRLFTEGIGALTFSKSEMDVDNKTNNADIVEQFGKLLGSNILQENVPLQEETEHGFVGRKFSNLGIISIVDNDAKKVIGDTVSANILSHLTERVNVVGATINGFTKVKNDYKSTAYIVYKFNSLPPHIQKLIDVHNEVIEKEKEIQSVQTVVQLVEKQVDYNNDSTDFFFGGESDLLDFDKPKPVKTTNDSNSLENAPSLEDIEKEFEAFFK